MTVRIEVETQAMARIMVVEDDDELASEISNMSTEHEVERSVRR